jgi:uncharacterized protein (DUF1501 family)
MGCCREHTRARLLRQAAAEAGRGLPVVEPGRPLPAGTGLDRRSFLLRTGGALLSVYGASKLGFRQLEEGIARAAGASNPVLVNVFLEGGIDSLSVLAPVEDGNYRAWRPTLALDPAAGSVFAEDGRLRWHPGAAPLDTLHREGKVAVVPAVGYSDADQSHFTSRHYYEVGELSTRTVTGWLGRLLDVVGSPDNPLQGVSLDGHLSPTLATASVPVAAIDGPCYDLYAPGVWDEVEGLMFDAVARLGATHATGSDVGLQQAGKAAAHSMTLRTQLQPFCDEDVTSPVAYPDDGFAESLAGLAALLGAGLPITCAAVDANADYDTHDNQNQSFAEDLGIAAQTLLAFQRDLEARGLADRVVTLVWSEFGRRPRENGSGGTDHGAGGLAMVIGSRVNGRMVGEFPGLGQLDEDENMLHTQDFRGVYAALLEQWFGVDAAAVIPGAAGFGRPALIR